MCFSSTIPPTSVGMVVTDVWVNRGLDLS